MSGVIGLCGIYSHTEDLASVIGLSASKIISLVRVVLCFRGTGGFNRLEPAARVNHVNMVSNTVSSKRSDNFACESMELRPYYDTVIE